MLIPLLALLACHPGSDPAADDTAGGTDPASTARGECNPVDPGQCLLPFPNDFFMVEDPSTGTGRRVSFGPTSLPENIDGVQMTPDFWNELDGFSTLGEVLAHLPQATLTGTIPWDDIGLYAAADARTVLIDVETGERVPHWVERDVFGGVPDRELLVLRPARPLRHGARHVVGIRGLIDQGGATLPPTPAFQVLRDGAQTDDVDVERQRGLYEDVVFPALDTQGFARDELQLAWSFTTVSKEGSLGRSLWMREDALAWVQEQAQGWSYSLSQVEEGDCSGGQSIGRHIEGTFTAPLYLEDEDPGSVLTRDGTGWPYRNGTVQVPFTVRIPCSLLLDPRPGPVMQFGHSLLASQDEVTWGNVGDIAHATGAVLLAVDWTGMAEADRGAVTTMVVTEPDRFAIIPERLMQGQVHALLARRLLAGPLATDAALTVDGQSLVDPEQTWFYGVSQGGVLGGGFGAYSPDVSRVVLNVPGTPFTLLLARSTGFAPFLIILQTMFEDPADVSLIIALMQSLWDPGEAAGYARFMNDEPLDETTPAKDVLILAGVGDGLVTALGAHVMARSYGAPLIAPAVREVWGVPAQEPPWTGSGFMEQEWGVDDSATAVPAEGDVAVHNVVPWTAPAMALVEHWLVTGEVIGTCDGACDPE